MRAPLTRDLAARDPAAAAALGILPQGGPQGHYGSDFGYGPFGHGFGFGFGADAVAAPVPTAPPPTAVADPNALAVPGGYPGGGMSPHHPAAAAHQHMRHAHHPAFHHHTQAILQEHYYRKAATEARLALITPNAGSAVDIQRYDFSINANPGIVIQQLAATVQGMSLQPATTIRPQRTTFNAPTFAFVMVSNILVGNVNGMVGGQTDAFNYGPGSMGVHLDLPSINPSNRIQVQATYTGLVPPVYPLNFIYPFTATFQCPATTVPNPSLMV